MLRPLLIILDFVLHLQVKTTTNTESRGSPQPKSILILTTSDETSAFSLIKHQRHPSLAPSPSTKASRTSYICHTAFADLGHSALHVALVIGFLSLYPAIHGYTLDLVMRTSTVGHGGPISLGVQRKGPAQIFPTTTNPALPKRLPPAMPVAGNKAISAITCVCGHPIFGIAL